MVKIPYRWMTPTAVAAPRLRSSARISTYRRMTPTLLALLLAGCASDPLPRDLPSMRTIYDRHLAGEGMREAGAASARTGIAPARWSKDGHLAGYTRDTYNEIENLFAHLPNPTLIMFIDPHLSEAGYPVPGYSTAFDLYAKPEFALPGEVPPPSRPVRVE